MANLGNNGVGYNASDTEKNLAKLKSDANYYKSELARTNEVIANRKAAGLDTSAQTNYLKTLNSIAPTVPSSSKTSSSSSSSSSSSVNPSGLINKVIDIGNATIKAAIKSAGLPATNAVIKAVNDATNKATNNIKESVSSPTQAVPAQPQIVPAQPQIDPNLANQIQELIGVLKQSSQPKSIPQYQSKYDGQIAQLLNQYNSMPEFQFDATNNPTIQAYQKQAADSAYQDARRRNMGYSTVATEGAAEAIANVLKTMGPQLEQQAYNQYRDQGQNILQQLQYLQSLDANDYARHMDAYNMGTASNQNYFNNTASIIDMMNKLDTQDYNRQQTAEQTEYAKQQDAIKNAMNESQLTGYYNPYAGMEISPEVQQYASDYQAEINRRRATPDTADDALIPQLEAARANKIFSSPDLLNQYGAQYKTIAQQAADLQNQIAQEQAKLQADPNSYENQKKYYELATMAEELNQLSTYGVQEQQLKLREIESRIKENAASASAAYALAEQRRNNPTGDNPTGDKPTDDKPDKFTTGEKNIFYLDALQSIKKNPHNAYDDTIAMRDYLLNTVGLTRTEYEELLKQAEIAQKANQAVNMLIDPANPLGAALKVPVNQLYGW